ncbi:hypothetical protein SEVIR_2G148550v4 [Setaria viridis]|uniref:Uncharacterized protein n=1 Tax=Setaria viridis TaxID=4556 RepID=A0A4U6VTR9_SETVI|nr:hypothetical protein SEVIR_2G148550v2 [Setaria viridis]
MESCCRRCASRRLASIRPKPPPVRCSAGPDKSGGRGRGKTRKAVQCRAGSRACMQEEVGTATAQGPVPASALDLPAYSRSKTIGIPPWCTHMSSTYCTTAGRPLQLLQGNTDNFLFKVWESCFFLVLSERKLLPRVKYTCPLTN